MKRRVFYSFHYTPDSWRAAQVRNIGTIEGNRPATDNDWEAVKKGGDTAIKKWISEQIHGRSCTVVLIGRNTANRKWINHEIIESWNNGMGVARHPYPRTEGQIARFTAKGGNPFDFISYGNAGTKLSAVVKCYDPTGLNSQDRYNWIARNLSNIVEEAVFIRQNSQ